MEEKEISSMNVIPLVDIMLVLLTIVLVSATFVAVGRLPVNLPSGKGEQAIKSLSIYVTKEGRLILEDREVSQKELVELLRGYRKDTQLFVGADRDARVEYLLHTLDLIKDMGFNKVSLGVQRR